VEELMRMAMSTARAALPPGRLIRGFRRKLQCLRRDQSGLSTVEFALLANVLVFGSIASADLGLAEYERLTIDHVLRAGAQSAMADQGSDQVLKLLESTASGNFAISTAASPTSTGLRLVAERYCTCPENTSAQVSCLAICDKSAPTFIFYRLEAAKIYKTMLLPEITFQPSLRVQVR
jgi:pilus assembly protein CpaE